MRYEIEFEYSDAYVDDDWHIGGCIVEGHDRPEAINECKRLYELGTKYVYRITKIQELLEEQPYVEEEAPVEESDEPDDDGEPDDE